MKSCKHESWLSLHGEEKFLLHCASTLNDIITGLDKPASKSPSLVVMLGSAAKGTLLTDAFPYSRTCVSSEASHGVTLQLDSATAFSDHPILIAHEDISRRSTALAEPAAAPCHRQTVRGLQWEAGSLTEAFDSLHSRLIRPFTDVVCFFSTGTRDVRHQVERMLPWLEQTRDRESSTTAHPRLLFVASSTEKRSEAAVKSHLVELLRTRSKQNKFDSFSHLSVYVKHTSTQTLTDRIKREVDASRNERVRSRTLLNAVHFDILFRQACDHFVSNEQVPFDMIAASRSHRPVSTHLHTYLSVLFDSVDNMEEIIEFAIPFAAGCFVVDNYAYDVPCQCFLVTQSFDLLTCTSLQPAPSVHNSLQVLYRCIWKQSLEAFETRWQSSAAASQKLYKVCLACMQADPQHKLTCGHVVCEKCFIDMGNSPATDPYLYTLNCCPFCSQISEVTVRVKPATAGLRVLSIDGGGIRAAIPIQFLCALENAIGLDIPIQEHFDLAYGTSSGGLVVLALYGLGMRVDESFHLFSQLAARIFRGRSYFGLGIFTALYALVTSWRHGRFPSSDIEGALAELFGEATMLDLQYVSSIGARVGLPVVDADTLDTCLVTSYNGSTSRYNDQEYANISTYRLLRSDDATSEIRIKDAARCTSAAPWYFTPNKIPGLGTFMDGGLSDNNPCMLAVQELHKIAPELRRADHFVSVGTGISTTRKVAKTGFYPSLLFGNSSLQQTAEHYWSENFNGDKRFALMRQIMAASLPGGIASTKKWLHRFNLPVEGELPNLDDFSAIGSLAEAASSYFTADPAVRDLADAALALTFYFELQPGRMPIYERGSYTCYGTIRCRIPGLSPAFCQLMQKLDCLEATFQIQMQVYDAKEKISRWLDRHGNFGKPVCLRVPSFDDELDIRLRLHKDRIHHISASPMTFRTLIDLQMLEWSALKDMHATPRTTSKKRRRDDSPLQPAKRHCSGMP
ncbi:hypothetical protein J3E72DRAFT_204316 [Bipolaris maydis]|nr:hypothetical protein J3E74DRAFT_230066 [Bipolaris maydis]KAJ5052481.1 hypothetical protein J3E74DRAFT_229381 [Bipolaris maydis]KAJ6192167.1 hypothetical protein J3E72DRAFT_204316 [Bipolaris maydis]KAJ6203624.1 hypothetical protein PSV09DRAFT_2205161 [Bipolaris maydis]